MSYRNSDNIYSVFSYPFGSCISIRGFSSVAHRYWFNGKEKEADGTADNYDFGARIYDAENNRNAKYADFISLNKKYGMTQIVIEGTTSEVAIAHSEVIQKTTPKTVGETPTADKSIAEKITINDDSEINKTSIP